MRPLSPALLALFLLPQPAGAADRDVIEQFGMLGRLALDCNAPAGPNNPNLIYTASPQGRLARTLRMEPSLDGTFAMYNLRMLGPDTMQFEETGRHSELTITVARIAGRFRSWRSVRADGTVLIADGKFPNTGKPTLAFERCQD
jgi:hypothetical protein